MRTALDIRERLRRTAVAANRSEDLAQDDRNARDGVIEEAFTAGLSVRTIARETGLSPSRVQSIGIEQTARRQAQLEAAAGLGGPPLPVLGTK